MLLGGGTLDGRRLLSRRVRAADDHRTTSPRPSATVGALFLEGQGWGFGGSVDDEAIDPWNVPGRYGWVGGTGTTAHIVPSTGAVAILLTQVGMTEPGRARDHARLLALRGLDARHLEAAGVRLAEAGGALRLRPDLRRARRGGSRRAASR